MRKQTVVLSSILLAGTFLFAGTARAASFRGEEIRVGDVVTFGRYEQDLDDMNGKEKLEWRVLDVDEDGDRALLITQKCIDTRPYHMDPGAPDSVKAVTWEDSSVRSWLNEDLPGFFYNEAFSEQDRSYIRKEEIPADENGHYKDANPGEVTRDSVFLLSEKEAKDYFKNGRDRRAEATKWLDDALSKPAENEKEGEDVPDEEETERDYYIDTQDTTGCVFWWLRTPGEDGTFAECVGAEGAIVQTGYLVNQMYFAVRPAIWVNLD